MSLRIAIKRSLEDPTTVLTTQPTMNNTMKKERRPIPHRRRRQRQQRLPVELPTINKCIRNSDLSKIDKFGFVELSDALSKSLIGQIQQEAQEKINRHYEGTTTTTSIDSPKRKIGSLKRTKQQPSPVEQVEEISNALQVDVSNHLLQKMKTCVEKCTTVKHTMQQVYGKRGNDIFSSQSNYNGFVLETPKVLVTEPGSNPQIPHADDHCSSCIICLIHLKDNQEPTRAAEYSNEGGENKDFPTGITVTCDYCNRMEQLPDSDYRRGVHLSDEKWQCHCKSPHKPYDFEGKISKAFGALLEEGAHTSLCDAYCGKKDPQAGDGILGLPMLIHRGPGNPTSASEPRYMLFFTLRPLYDVPNTKQTTTVVTTASAATSRVGTATVPSYHRYNPALQIHASCILYNKFKKVKSIYEGSGCGLEGFVSAVTGLETASLTREVEQLKEENKLLREQAAKRSRDGEESVK